MFTTMGIKYSLMVDDNNNYLMGVAAEGCAKYHGITREEQVNY
jgi:acetyl-CoA acetyltransferase